MKAIILAAGQGTRLKKYTQDLPKGMLSFMGKTIIERQIELYEECGIDDIIVVTGFASERINYKGVKYYHNERFEETNMVESLMTAKPEFDDDIIVSYSDILFEKRLLEGMMNCNADFGCAVDDEWQEYWNKRYGKVNCDTESLSIDENDNITELGLEGPLLEDIDARYIGLLKFSNKGMQTVVDTMERAYEKYEDKSWQQSGKPVRKAYMTDLLNALIEAGECVKAVHFNHGWIEFDTNDDYEKANEWVKDNSILKVIRL